MKAIGHRRGASIVGFALALLSGCREEAEEKWSGPPESNANDAPQAASPDRLPPGELLEGSESAFGFSIPKGMKLTRISPKMVRVTGKVDFDALTEYVKDRIAVRHAEMLDGELVFPNARIRGNQEGVYRLSLSSFPLGTKLVIQDKTRPPGTGGLTEKQRWERTGLRPSGGLIDPNQME